MVERRPDPKDRRICACTSARLPTRHCARSIDTVPPWPGRLTAGLDPATLDTMAEVLVLMKAALSHERGRTSRGRMSRARMIHNWVRPPLPLPSH